MVIEEGGEPSSHARKALGVFARLGHASYFKTSTAHEKATYFQRLMPELNLGTIHWLSTLLDVNKKYDYGKID